MNKNPLYSARRKEVAETALALLTTGLVVNTSGNASMRVGDHILITPSGRDYDSLKAADICVLDLHGNSVDGEFLPSSETPLHLSIYKFNPNVTAIVHTHSVHATAVSTLTRELPAIHYQMVDLGGPVPVAPYATFGSDELAQSVMSVLPGHTAVLMQNHGSISIGDSLKQALARTVALEWCSEVWLKAQMAGKPSTLSVTQMAAAEQQMAHFAELRSKCECG